MKWRSKARIQNMIAALPEPLASFCYYHMQRRFGGLRAPVPVRQLSFGCLIASAIHERRPLTGLKIMEVGTGRSLGLPMLMWTLGAASVLTVDLNRYLKPEILQSDLAWMRQNRPWLDGLVAPLDDENGTAKARLNRLLEPGPQLAASEKLGRVLQLCNIRYEAPADAATLDLPEHSLDVHLSQAVMEHVPPEDLRRILKAALKFLRPDGLCVHWIGPSDHFQHNDPTISQVNFLQFTDAEWDRLAGNRFMYMNRLRASDYVTIFEECGLEVLDVDCTVDEESRLLLESGGLPLDEQFRGKSVADLATTELLVVARPKQAPA